MNASDAHNVGFTVKHRVNRPVNEVFQAVVDPAKLSTYFTTSADAPLSPGRTVHWHWEGYGTVDVHVHEVVENEKIVFSWEAYKVDYDVTCTFTFESINDGATRVTVHETGWKRDEAGLASSFAQCNGWTHMLMCLKARLEHDIDLRDAFDVQKT
ncbi:MAG: SRPBCC domain-containing protein [Phycisphaerales bacterium]|nr:MAG: SRPBCC domain-containing protein [Phycisphaerales bacterium]